MQNESVFKIVVAIDIVRKTLLWKEQGVDRGRFIESTLLDRVMEGTVEEHSLHAIA